MKIGCNKCSSVFESLVVIPDMAWKEVFEKLMAHTIKEHHEFYQLVSQEATNFSAATVTYVLIAKLAKNVEKNKWLEDKMGQTADQIMGMLGYDRVNEDEEEEEEEGEEEEDTNDDKEDTKEMETPIFEETD